MDNEEYTVVIVDDEEMVTTSISTLFMLETDYDVLAFNSPREALDEFDDTEVDLVISDYLMPGEMTGVDFLIEVKKLQPEATRILLTAYADKDNAIRAINDLGLYHYVEKPWDNENLLLLVRNGLERGKFLKQLMAKAEELGMTKEKLQQIQNEILKTFI